MPHKAVAGLTSSVPATEYVARFIENKIVPALKFTRVNDETVSSIIASLNTHKATAADGLSALLIRVSPHMVRLITTLVNKCISSSLFPSQWKQAVVTQAVETPVPKCEQCTSLSPFQLISVLPALSKVLECVLHDQIFSHLHKYDVLSAHQSGFRSGYSTQDVSIYVIDKWLKAIDKG